MTRATGIKRRCLRRSVSVWSSAPSLSRPDQEPRSAGTSAARAVSLDQVGLRLEAAGFAAGNFFEGPIGSFLCSNCFSRSLKTSREIPRALPIGGMLAS